jgi:molybdopterin molybdotransferase
MISVAEADRLLARFRDPWPAETVSLHAAAGRILREDIRADRPYPAQDRSYMDGVAIAFGDWEKGAQAFPIEGVARAGAPRAALAARGACVEIMTGAAIPEGADTVIAYEDVDIAHGIARVKEGVASHRGRHVHVRGTDCDAGDVLVAAGSRLHAAHVATAASVGASRLVVSRLPRVAIVATGDELVDIGAVPAEHQLRASNGAALAALFAPFAEVSERRCGDDPGALQVALSEALSMSDILLVTGGVSAGKFDLVPDALAARGVEKVFHKIAQKPGKPLWFGTWPSPPTPLPHASVAGEGPTKDPERPESAEEAPRFVFGLPGNPVSTLVCARRYVLPLLWAKSGWARPAESASHDEAVPASRLTRFLSVRVEENDGIRRTFSAPINGSGDFAGFGRSDGFVEAPSSENARAAGEKFSFFPWIS